MWDIDFLFALLRPLSAKFLKLLYLATRALIQSYSFADNAEARQITSSDATRDILLLIDTA